MRETQGAASGNLHLAKKIDLFREPVLAREEKRFADAGFGRGVVLAKSAHDYHKAILEWRKKSDSCAEDYNAAKKRLDAFTAELKRKEAQARKLLDEVADLRRVCVPLRKKVHHGDILQTRLQTAQRRFAEKVELLSRMEIA